MKTATSLSNRNVTRVDMIDAFSFNPAFGRDCFFLQVCLFVTRPADIVTPGTR